MPPPIRLLLFVLLAPAAVSGAVTMRDSGFEATPLGRLTPAATSEGWHVQCAGREAVRPRLVVACVANLARTGNRCLSLSIPADTVGFEFVTVGQQLRLADTKTYEVIVWKLYVQINGWGNFGNGVTVSVRELSCRAIQTNKP